MSQAADADAVGKSPNIITASLCDSRSCNQTGGGGRLKPDIEDLLQLLPGDNHRVRMITCLGLCNRSPNAILKSKEGAVFTSKQGKLVNDGGLRMKVEKSVDAPKRKTKRLVVSGVTIQKIANAVQFDRPNLVRAVECKQEGRQNMEEEMFQEASDHFTQALSWCQAEEASCADAKLCHLQASLSLCSSTARIQLARHECSRGNIEKQMSLLQVAAFGPLIVLENSATIDQGEEAEGGNDISRTRSLQDTIHDAVQCQASTATTYFNKDVLLPVSKAYTSNEQLLARTLVVLADAWSDLSVYSAENVYRDSALAAYEGVLESACSLRAREKRHIRSAMAAIVDTGTAV